MHPRTRAKITVRSGHRTTTTLKIVTKHRSPARSRKGIPVQRPLGTATPTRSRPTPTSPQPRIHPPQRRKSTGLPQTTPDNFRDPPPRRIMKSGRVPPHQAIYLARDTIRAAATRSEGGHGGEPADRQKTTSTAPATTTTRGQPPTSGKDHRTDVRVNDVSRSSRVDIEQSRYSRSPPHTEGRADPGEEYLLNATLGKRCAHRETRRSTPPRASGKDTINDTFANRTRVRAKIRVGMIENHSMQSMKKAS